MQSQRWNNLQIYPTQDLNTAGIDLWSNTPPLDHRGALQDWTKRMPHDYWIVHLYGHKTITHVLWPKVSDEDIYKWMVHRQMFTNKVGDWTNTHQEKMNKRNKWEEKFNNFFSFIDILNRESLLQWTKPSILYDCNHGYNL